MSAHPLPACAALRSRFRSTIEPLWANAFAQRATADERTGRGEPGGGELIVVTGYDRVTVSVFLVPVADLRVLAVLQRVTRSVPIGR
jgi:hypothetical protein